MSEARPPLPPFTRETAIQKIRAAEDAWNTRDPERVSLAYAVDSQWRNRSENGLMRRRHASINDLPIRDSDRKFHWDRSGPRPADHPGLTDLGL